jgi:mono/diheme cytochrome c family protein
MLTAARLRACLVLAACLHGAPVPAQADKPDELVAQAREVLIRHCFECHGKDPKKIKKKLHVLDRNILLDKKRKIVVPGKPDESLLLQRVNDDEQPMPPDDRPRVPDAERKVLRAWIAAGASPFPEKAETAAGSAPAAPSPGLAAQVKELFRTRCFDCHGGAKTEAGVKILDRQVLLAKRKIVPGNPDGSKLFQSITTADENDVMPKGQPRLSPENVDLVRRWLAEGAPDFPADLVVPEEKNKEAAFKDVVGVSYVLQKILADVRTLPLDERRYVRYFSINHLLTGGTTRDTLDLHREALAKAVNHLSWEKEVVRPRSIDDPVKSVFAVDIRKLGWNRQPFDRVHGREVAGRSEVNVFDLALLEYPYGIVYEDSETFDLVQTEFLGPARQVRPIPYVRADWFVSVCTQPPLYEDFLGLPFELAEVEKLLGVDVQSNLTDGIARRAGMTVSGVSRNNRVVERHPARGFGYYWKSFDFRTSKGTENMFRDPIHLNPAGGEMIFGLPNGMQGYFVTNATGDRVEFAPTDIVTDKNAEDKTVRNGLACMRCHDQGMKTFEDSVHPALERLPGSAGIDKRYALQLYPGQDVLNPLVKGDGERFLEAMKQVLGRDQTREPLIPVTQRFLEAPLTLRAAAAELGLAGPEGLREAFRAPQFTGLGLLPLASEGVVRRDMWDDYFDQIVRQLGLGLPLPPLDGLTRRDFEPLPPPFAVELKTNKKNNIFEPGDTLVIFVANKSSRDLYIELVATGARGEKVILAGADTVVRPGEEYRFPPEGKAIKIRGRLGKELLTVFASDAPFPPGELLRGKGVTDRVVHPCDHWRRSDKFAGPRYDPARIVKKTITIETR